MRLWPITILLLASACQQRAKAPAQFSQLTFDGAQVSSASALRVHGERLTHVLGCTGCHGKDLQGTFFTADEPQYGPLYASNLTRQLPKFSDVQLEALLRTGVHPERKTVWAMPSEIFHNLSSGDMKSLILYLRTLRPMGKPTPLPRFSAQDKKDIAAGIYKPAVERVKDFSKAQPVDLGRQYALGRYISSVTCEECHGSSLSGDMAGPVKTPNLIVAGAYTRAEFERLMVAGVAAGGRKLNPMMSGVAKTRFSRLTPHERDALYAYLKARADKLGG
jgi:cytochrome c553